MTEIELYKIDTSNFRQGVVGVITDTNNNLLLFQRSDRTHEWQFPQGGLKKTETAEQAVLREIREETGLQNIQIIKKSEMKIRYLWPKARRHLLGQEQTWFSLTLDQNTVVDLKNADDSFIAARWMTEKDIWSHVTLWKQLAYKNGLTQLGLLK